MKLVLQAIFFAMVGFGFVAAFISQEGNKQAAAFPHAPSTPAATSPKTTYRQEREAREIARAAEESMRLQHQRDAMRRLRDAEDDLSAIAARTERNLKQIQVDSEFRRQQIETSHAANMRALEDDRQRRARQTNKRFEEIRTDSLARQQQYRGETEAARAQMERLFRK